MPKYRKHSIEEKRKRSKLRKKHKKERQRTAVDAKGVKPVENCAEETKSPVRNISVPSVGKQGEERAGTSEALNATRDINAGQKRSRKELEEQSNSVEELKKKRDAAHRHAVIFYNNWMKSERANLPLINLKNIKITERNVAKGSYGLCHVGFYGATNVAVKKIERWDDTSIEEAAILRKLRHPNIQMFLGLAWQENDAHIVSKFHSLQGKSVTLANTGEEKLLTEKNWQNTASQGCDAVRYLHREAEILHNDIKPNNIVVEHGCDPSVVIPILIAFGKACAIHDARVMLEEKDQSKFPFLAPELNKGERQSTGSDIFSLGYTIRRVSHIIKDFSLRNIYRSCLSDDPPERPEIVAILRQFK